MTNSRFVFIAAMVLILSACSTPSSNVADVFAEASPKTAPAIQPPPSVADVLIPDFDQTLDSSQNTFQQTRMNISVYEIDAREFFMGLVVDTDLNMLIHPDVSGTISLELKNVTIPQILDAVQKLYGYDYKKSDIGYIIYPATLQTKTFKIDRLDLLRIGTSNTSVSSGKQSGTNNSSGNSSNSQSKVSGNNTSGNNPMGFGGSSQNMNSSANSSSSSVRTITNTDFWQELKDTLTHIIAVDPQATVDINQQSGVIVARAKPAQLREIESFLSATRSQIGRQVTLEAKILEVTLDDQHQNGINWESIVREGIDKAPLLTGIGGVMTSPNEFASIFTLGGHSGDFRAFVELMETQGKTNVLSSPRISTLNNQTAIIKVGQDEYFAYDIQSNTSGSTAAVSGTNIVTTPFPRLDVFFSGIALDVTPQIDDNENITLHIHPSITQVTEETKTFGNNIGSLPLALTTVRESDSIVKAKNGQVIVLGGLMQEKSEDNKTGVTGLASIPYIGNLFRVNKGRGQKSELIILLKATYIGSDEDWQNDINASQRRFEKLDSQPLWK